MNETLSRLSGIIHDVSSDVTFDPDRDADTKLGDLGLDSLDNMSLFLMVQERFHIGEIPDADIDGMDTANEIVAYVEARAP